jgi:FdhE protein
MITINEIAEKRPHLKDVLRLYEKVVEFDRKIEDLHIPSPLPGDIAYPSSFIDPVLETFSSVFDVPAGILAPLGEAMKLGQVDISRLPLNDTPAFSLPYHESDLQNVLFIVSRPFFRRFGTPSEVPALFWEEGRCPVCHAVPSLAFLTPEEGRTLSCSYCSTRGKWHRIGCPHCENRDARKLEIIEIEQEKGFRIDICNECKSYLKTTGAGLLKEYSADLLDIISLPLDILAQNRGYKRRSPNSLGMTEMI